MADILIKRGLQANVQSLVLKEGELAVALDTGNVYVGTTAGKHHINPKGETADAAKKLETARNFSITGDGTASAVAFDGTGNVALALALATQGGLAAGTYTKLTVNAKGIVTGAANITVSDVSGLGTAATKNTGTAAGNVVVLDANGKIDSNLIPSIAMTDCFEAASETAMLALSTAGPGDVCVRTDENKTYILKATPASTLANWVWLRTPDCKVISVAGKTGAVVLAKADVGLGSVDNTADSAKNVASAAKLTTARVINGMSFDGTANIANYGTTTGTNTYVVALTGFSLVAGAVCNVKFTAANTATAITLNINGTGAKTVLESDGSAPPVGAIAANSVYGVVYDGTSYYLNAIYDIPGTAGQAAKLQTARTIGTSGDVTGTATAFDGSGNITIVTTLANSGVTVGTYTKVTVDAKGRVTTGAQATKADVGLGSVDNTADSAKNVASAAKLTTARTISLSGGATASGSFDGSANLSLSVTALDASKLTGTVDGGTF